ncbi:MAG: gamma-mobile-trio recombinase GmtY [Burkholderiales bacterium]
MDFTICRARVYRDNTGVAAELPIILTERGPLQPLLDYMLSMEHARSYSWKQKMTQSVGLLLDYMAVNHDCFEDPKILFQSFVQRLYSGTVREDGMDPSGLFWLPKTPANVKQLVNQLSAFSDWMAENLGTTPLNPWREATHFEEMLHWAAYHQKHGRSFLGHTWDKGRATEAAKQAKHTILKRNPVIDHDGVKVFPDERIMELLFEGFIVPGQQKSRRIVERLNLRDILIAMLMHFGGLRMSEPFHLYVHDVQPDPINREQAMVRVFHPGEGLAPDDWKDVTGKFLKGQTRAAYLRGKYGMQPRNLYPSTAQLHAGWKDNVTVSTSKFMYVHWFPAWSGELFLKLWNSYMIQRAMKTCDHPFAFITLTGNPYALDSFKDAHAAAIERIGLSPGKMLGTTPHAHRHAYGKRLADVELGPLYIKNAMHHKSMESQVIYTEPQARQVTEMMNRATRALNAGQSLVPPDFLRYGFEDVDPVGLFSSQNPKVRKP